MDSLFKKLNLLLKSSINDLLGDERSASAARRRESLDFNRLGKDIDQEVAAFRQRINDALDHSDTLQARVNQLRDDIARTDQEADQAVRSGREEEARRLIQQIKWLEQQLAIAEADLDDHQRVTQDLIRQVNILESTVADARRIKAEEADASAPEEQRSEPPDFSRPQQFLSDVLRDARERVENAIGSQPQTEADDEPGPSVDDRPMTEEDTSSRPRRAGTRQDIDDDLANRRARLSKPPDKPDK